jgi:hypothetical protein
LFSFLSFLGKGFKFGDPRGKAPPKTTPVAKFGDPVKVEAANRGINPASTAYETK